MNLVTVILFTQGSPAAYGPAIVLSKLYANSMMVLLNDRIPSGHGYGGQAVAQMVTKPLGSIHFATTPGLADTAQEQIPLEGADASSSITGRVSSDS